MSHADDVRTDHSTDTPPIDAPPTDAATLRDVTAAAAEIFTTQQRRQAAKTYLGQRGIDANGLGPSWIIGYAPPGWTRLVDALRGEFDDRALLDAGVARRCSRGTLIDTFRDRVIFGIRNGADARLAGFTGRDLSGDPNTPKYLNTRRHALFDKSSLLFGLCEGGHALYPQQPVIVEGPLDVLAITARIGRNRRDLLPVAPCGTAFTDRHARQVGEVASFHGSSVVVAMDGDAAGELAALSAGERLRSFGLDVRVAQLPDGSDPAAYLTRDGACLDTFHADNGLPLLTVQVQHAIAQQGDRMQWIEGRLGALRNIARYLASNPTNDAARQVNWLSDALDLEPSTIAYELARAHPTVRRGDSHPNLDLGTRCDREL